MYCSILLFCDNVTMEFSGQVSILESMGSEKLDMVFYLIHAGYMFEKDVYILFRSVRGNQKKIRDYLGIFSNMGRSSQIHISLHRVVA